MSRSLCCRAAVLALLTLASGFARADLGAAQGYNLFVFDNLSTSGLSSQGSVAVGGSTSGSVWAPSSSTSSIDFSAAQSQLTGLSNSLAALAANGTTSVTPWRAVNLTGTSSTQNVFNVKGSDLTSGNGLYISTPSGSTVVINVDGSGISLQNMGIFLGAANQAATTSKDKILFNFTQASSLNISSINVIGSILAPHASVSFSNGAIDGTLIAQSVSGSGTYKINSFTGTIAAVPEPQTWTMLVAGLGMLGIVLRRRRR
jgi:hypothetical protein